MSPQLAWLAGTGLALFTLAVTLYQLRLELRDSYQLKIVSVRPRIFARSDGHLRELQIVALDVIVENVGKRAALDCNGMVSFPTIEGLPLYPNAGGIVDLSSSTFTVNPHSRRHLVAAWRITGSGVVDDTVPGVGLGDFLCKAIPATAIVVCGVKQANAFLDANEIRQLLDEHERRTYLKTID